MKLRCLAFILFLAPLIGTAADENPYLAAGVPATDRAWLGQDYLDTFEAISTGKAPLPMLNDPQGKLVLQRLTNEENFGLHRNKSLPTAQRLSDFAKLQQALNSIFKLYIVEANKGKKVNAEAAIMMAFTMKNFALSIDLANEFLVTVPKDQMNEARSQGVRQMYGGLMISFSGAETSLGETKFYTPADLTLILQAMRSTFPTMLQAFTPDYKLEMKGKLTNRKAQFSGEDLAALEEMIKILDTQPESEKPSK